MGPLGMIGAFLGGLLLLYLIGLLFVIPLKIIGKLLINGVIGFVLLYLLNLIGGGLLGFTIALNPVNALIAGFFGIPGVIVLAIFTCLL